MRAAAVTAQARAAELRQQKVEHEKAWAAAQRERELQKVRPHVFLACGLFAECLATASAQ